jgi:hypothetical protein
MSQTGQRLLTATEKIYKSWVGMKTLVVCNCLNTLIFQNLPNVKQSVNTNYHKNLE